MGKKEEYSIEIEKRKQIDNKEKPRYSKTDIREKREERTEKDYIYIKYIIYMI